MPTPSIEGDIVLGASGAGVLLRNDLDLPVGSTTSGAYWLWVEDFNPMPAVQMSTNDTPIVYDHGSRPGGDVALSRPYSFEMYAAWEDDAGLAQLLSDLTAVATPLATGTTEMSFKFAGQVWTVAGRFEPFSLQRTEVALAHQTASFTVRFRATDPILRSGATELL